MEMNKEQINEVNGLGPLYEMRYPEIKSSFYEKEGHNYVHNNIVVNADQVDNSPLQNLCKHNTEVKDDTKGLGYYLQPSVQRKAGLSPIPFDEIGVKDNRFLNSR